MPKDPMPDLSRHQKLLLDHQPHLDRIIGRRLTAARESRCLSLEELSLFCGVPADELRDYESGEIPIAMSRVRLIAATLDLTALELFTRLVCPSC